MQSFFKLRGPNSGWLIFTVIGIIFLAVSAKQEERNIGNKIATRVRRGYTEQYKQNVSCIAHDAKFTCDCQNNKQHMLLPHLIGNVFQVEISNCKALTIEAYSLEDTQALRKITFKNIANLVLKQNALSFSRHSSNTPLIIEFQQVNFELIDSHAISGNIEEISFIGGRIDVIHPFGFTTLKDRAILLKMENVLVQKIEPQAFKKFAVDQMEITNCIFATNLPSKAFYELEVLNTLMIHNVKFQEVHTKAFSFKLVYKLSIANNIFQGVDSEWIEAHVRESAVIRGNHFGATSQISFKGVAVHRDYIASEKLELRYSNNTVSFPPTAVRPLEFNERFRLNIEQLRYENYYSCKDLDASFKPARPRLEFFQKYAENILFQRKISGENQSFVPLGKIIELDCKQPSYLLYIVLGVLALVLVVVIVAIVVCLRIAKRNKRRKLNVVLPEPRTYKETQIVYQIENAGLLKTDL